MSRRSAALLSALLPALMLAVLSAAPQPAAAAVPPPGWEYYAEIAIGRPGLTDIRLPFDALERSRPRLDDLRILDPGGREVPYLLQPQGSIPAMTMAARDVRWSVAGENTVGIFHNSDAWRIDGLTIVTPTGRFFKPATVESSPDGKTWSRLTADFPLYHQDGAWQPDIPIPAGDYPYLRVTIDDRRDRPIPITGLSIHVLPEEPRSGFRTETVRVPIDDVVTTGGETRVYLTLPSRNMRPLSVELEPADRFFTRRVSVYNRSYEGGEVVEQPAMTGGAVYRVPTDREANSSVTVVPLPGGELEMRNVALVVENGDSPPLDLGREVKVHYLVRAARIMAQSPGTYLLVTGNPAARAPAYDLRNIPTLTPRELLLRSMSVALVEAGPLMKNRDFKTPEILPGLDTRGGEIDTSPWKYRKKVTTAGQGLYSLETDPEVLINAEGDFNDLRLISGGRQVPFIYDRNGPRREISPTVETLKEPPGSRRTRYRLTLPYRGLPLTSMTCSIKEAIFRRPAVLYIENADERDRLGRAVISSDLWTRVGADQSGFFTMGLGRPITSETVILEIDNGDNAPVTVGGFAFQYRTARLLFKSGGDMADLQLIYGNLAAPRPRYDIDLVAGEIISGARQPAATGPEERFKGTGLGWTGWGVPDLGRWKVAFWAALLLTVVILVAVIVKLLPEEREAGSTAATDKTGATGSASGTSPKDPPNAT